MSFAVISYVTPAGKPRSSGAVHAAAGRNGGRAGACSNWCPAATSLAYGLGVSLRDMAKPQAALAHVPVF